MLTPIHGHWTPFLPSPAAADVKELTRLSYRPPAAMEPTPTWDSSNSSSPSASSTLGFLAFFLEAAGGGAGDASDGVDSGPPEAKPGGAEAATVASYMIPV